MKRRLACVAVVSVLLTGCTGGQPGLELVSSDTQVCIPPDDEGRVLVSYDVFVNESDEDVRVTGVELLDPVAITLVGADLHPVDDGHFTGYSDEFDRDAPERWELRTVPPGAEYELMLGLRAGPDGGSMMGARLSFEGTDATVDSSIAVAVPARGTECQWTENPITDS